MLVTPPAEVDKHCSPCGLWTFQIRLHHQFCQECAALADNNTTGTVQGEQLWSSRPLLCLHRRTYLIWWSNQRWSFDVVTWGHPHIRNSNSSSASSTVRRTCLCGWWSNIMELASWRSLRCDITINISSFTKGTFVYHRVWKQLIMMLITLAWIAIVKQRCGLIVR